MPTYTVRRATPADTPALVRHRIRMFQDMGVMQTPDPREASMSVEFQSWLVEHMSAGTYVAWVVEAADTGSDGAIVSGGGATIIPWPPGPHSLRRQLAFVYNVYTEPAHRGRGLARRVMDAIHGFCRDENIGAIALNASQFGLPLYESMGYRVASSPMMLLALE